MKKKLFSAGLAAMLALSVPAAVMADAGSTTVTTKNGTTELDVSVTYAPIDKAPVVYSVDIEWGSMEFTYYAPALIKTWNPASHTYETETADTGHWENAEGANVVKLGNRSNIALDATVSAAMLANYQGITAKVGGTEGSTTLPLKDASIGATTTVKGTVSKAETTISLEGDLTDDTANKTTIGNITVTIKDAVTGEEQP